MKLLPLLLLLDATFATCDAIAEIQAVSVSAAMSGTFTLTYDTATHCKASVAAATATALADAASASDVRAALGALSNTPLVPVTGIDLEPGGSSSAHISATVEDIDNGNDSDEDNLSHLCGGCGPWVEAVHRLPKTLPSPSIIPTPEPSYRYIIPTPS